MTISLDQYTKLLNHLESLCEAIWTASNDYDNRVRTLALNLTDSMSTYITLPLNYVGDLTVGPSSQQFADKISVAVTRLTPISNKTETADLYSAADVAGWVSLVTLWYKQERDFTAWIEAGSPEGDLTYCRMCGNPQLECVCTKCPGCKNIIDETVCHCGIDYDSHRWEEHSFVPQGCSCYYDRTVLVV